MAKQAGDIAPVNAMEKITKTGIASLKKITGDIGKLKVAGDQLIISGIEDAPGYKLVDEHRKVVKNIRTAIERKRKELNEPALKFQRDVNAIAKELTEKLTPIENDMAAKLKVVDDEKTRIATAHAQMVSDRTNSLYKRGMMFNGTGFSYKNIFILPDAIGQYSEEQWQQITGEVDKAIQADKIEEPIFPVGQPEPQTFVEPIEPEIAAPYSPKPNGNNQDDEIEFPRGSDFQASDFTHRDGPGPVQVENIGFTPTVTTFKGLECEVYRAVNFPDCTINGSSSKHAKLLLIGPGVPEIHTETNPERVVKLEFIQAGAHGAVTIEGNPVRVKTNHPYVKPMSIDPGTGSMFGGNFIYTSDSRFPSDQPIGIHDRVETGVYDGR